MLNKHFLQDIVIDIFEAYDMDNAEGVSEEYIRIKLDLRFSNKESSKQFTFYRDGKRQDMWKDFNQNFHKVSVKPTDLNFLKLFIVEQELEE